VQRLDIKGRDATLKVREVIKLIEADGWRLARTVGSHRQYIHPIKPGRVTVAGHPNDDVHPKTLISMLKQAQFKKAEMILRWY